MKYTKKANVKYSYSRPKKDITGKKIHDLEVLKWIGFKEVGKLQKRRSVYLCKCDCGNTCEVTQGDLTSGNTKSCGCRIRNGRSYKGKNYSTITRIYNNYRQSAKRHNREFSLERKDFEQLIFQECYYCGDKPKIMLISDNNRGDILYYNGIDRVDNSLGYIPTNVVTCCKACNFLKNNRKQEDFLKIIKKIYECRIRLN